MTQSHPVSPLPFVCMPGTPGHADDGEDLDVVNEDVVAEDALDGKATVVEKPSVKPLPSPKPMTEAEWEEHCAKGHVHHHDGCPYCVGGATYFSPPPFTSYSDLPNLGCRLRVPQATGEDP